MFDLDGTLFDTAPGITSAVNAVLAHRGVKHIDPAIIRKFVGHGLRDMINKLDDHHRNSLGDLETLTAEFQIEYRKTFLPESFLYPGLLDFLHQWDNELAVVSNKNDFHVHELIAKTQLNQFHWGKLVGGNTYLEKKPHPLPLIETLKHFKLQPKEVLMIGDGLPDILAAKAAGVKSIAVSFGYSSRTDLVLAGAHALIDDYNKLTEVVQSFNEI